MVEFKGRYGADTTRDPFNMLFNVYTLQIYLLRIMLVRL